MVGKSWRWCWYLYLCVVCAIAAAVAVTLGGTAVHTSVAAADNVAAMLVWQLGRIHSKVWSEDKNVPVGVYCNMLVFSSGVVPWHL